MSSYTFGVESIRDLIGAPEDVRRFDAALIVNSGDVDQGRVSSIVRNPPRVEHVYTRDLCRELILWAWTRKESQVVIDPDAADLMAVEGVRMSDKYTDDIPIVDRGTMRHKLSRLAVGLAGRTFSTGETEHVVRVRRCHAEYIVQLLNRLYDAKSFGYKYLSDAIRNTSQLIDHAAIKAYLQNLPFPKEVRERLLYADTFDLVDVQDWCGYERVQAQDVLSFLSRKRGIKRDDRKYQKTPEFIQWLKGTELQDKPQHLKDDEGKF